MDSIHKLTELFKEFPGIGPRQAKRFVYFLLVKNGGYSKELIQEITRLKESVAHCTSCFRFFPKDHMSLCSICRDTNRTTNELMIVCRDVDLEAIEKTKIYNGSYFVLGGTISILEKNPHDKIRITQLEKKIQTMKEVGLQEIIIASDYTPEGEHTREYIEKMITTIDAHIRITHLGRGLSTGSEIEYVDGETIKNALKNRE